MHRGGGNSLKPSHNHGLHLFLGCLDAKMHRGKVCYDKSSLRANAKQSRETVITRSDKRRSNRIHIEKDEIGATHVALCDGVGSYFRHWCGAFTLAEVLITLGIIGVVAAMTLPTLIESHNRQVVETRLEKFYSTINQAIVRAEVDFGDRSDWYQDTNNIETDENGKPINGSSGVEKWWNTYLAPYVKTVGIDYDNGLPVFKFADGSCLKANQATAMRDWIYYTTSRDRCIKMAGSEENSRGVCSFSFMYVPTADSPYFYKKGFEPYKSGWNGTESGLYNACKKSDNKMDKSLCGALIQYNGWKIPKSYPLKVKY